MTTFHVQQIVLYNRKRKLYHTGYLDLDSGVLSTPESCNLDQVKDALDEYPDLPDDVPGDQLCRRCFGGAAD